jgi:hypothetical protein
MRDRIAAFNEQCRVRVSELAHPRLRYLADMQRRLSDANGYMCEQVRCACVRARPLIVRRQGVSGQRHVSYVDEAHRVGPAASIAKRVCDVIKKAVRCVD